MLHNEAHAHPEILHASGTLLTGPICNQVTSLCVSMTVRSGQGETRVPQPVDSAGTVLCPRQLTLFCISYACNLKAWQPGWKLYEAVVPRLDGRGHPYAPNQCLATKPAAHSIPLGELA